MVGNQPVEKMRSANLIVAFNVLAILTQTPEV
jgi:hypothetical protein